MNARSRRVPGLTPCACVRLVDGAGRILQQGNPVTIDTVVKPGEQAAAATGLGNLPQEQLQALRFRVDDAKLAQ